MSLTLDEVAALIVIDLQKGILAIPTAHPAVAIVEHCAQLAHAFRETGLPVVLVNVDGRAPGRTEATMPAGPRPADWCELVPELDPQPGDVRITKRRFGAFLGTILHAELQRRGATQVVMTGISTSIGVESTARSAYDLGYNVAFVVDAMTDRSSENHRHSVENLFPRIGETGTTEDVLALLAGRSSR
ncbi:MAG TPA: isochorismatase family protein [Thermoanaerobaculia bacterium]|nr:isochorismatase family protein [Thermoanaerobaculia bacterium]